MYKRIILLSASVFLFFSGFCQQNDRDPFKPFSSPVSFSEATKRADTYISKLSTKEKMKFINGYKLFFIRGFQKYNMPMLYTSDATAGVHIRKLIKGGIKKSVSFPCPLALAATWNTVLAHDYAWSIGDESKAAGVSILLGPGMNIYRISQCGRNFEYFGEDPYLASRMVENYVIGMQSTGTMATLKHFLCNNTDFHRRNSNSIVDERTLHEIYLPAFKAGVDAGAMAVMTSYNQVNGEWTGQSSYVIKELLRNALGFKWLVMTDWWSVNNTEKVIKSGQTLVMPGHKFIRKDAKKLLKNGQIKMSELDSMCKNIIRTSIAMGFYDNPRVTGNYSCDFKRHENIALQTARESIVLLRNEDKVLPLDNKTKILLTGDFVTVIPQGGGSSIVKGYNHVTMLDALKKEFGDRIEYIKSPSDGQIKKAPLVLLSTGTVDNEGRDRPFELPEEKENLIQRIAGLNPNTVVVVNSGSGIRMSQWNKKVKAILYCWYPGQNGYTALAEILAGKTNPSGKLPMTIEELFEDSPGYSYIPENDKLYSGWMGDFYKKGKMFDINYKEGVFVGYRWYEAMKFEPLYPFGSGLSYTSFSYENLRLSSDAMHADDTLIATLSLGNMGDINGAEVVQLYVGASGSSVPRPAKELKGFRKVMLQAGEVKQVEFKLTKNDFSYWDVNTGSWQVEPVKYTIFIGSSSVDIRQTAEFAILK